MDNAGRTVRDRLVRAFYVLFAACFTLVVMSCVILNGSRGGVELLFTALGVPVCVVGVWLVKRLLDRFSGQIERRYRTILWAFSGAMFLAELFFALALRHGTWFDVAAVFDGAVEWVETGAFSGYYEYYGYFPNNLGGMTFLYAVFRLASWVGFTDYYAAASLAACLMLTGAMALTSLICRELAGASAGVLALAVFALSPQFWFLGGAVYTDVLSMLFPALFFYCYLRFRDGEGRRRPALLLIMGLTMGIGSQIKFTVLIAAIAALLDALLRKKPADALKIALCAFGITAVIGLSLNGALYSTQLSREEARENNTPLIHWVMMGLKGDGYYNPEDYTFTRSLPAEGRNQILLDEIIHRVRQRGPGGMLELTARKSAADFGNGTYGADDFLKIPPHEDTVLHRFLLQGGAYYGYYRGYTSALHVALMAWMLWAAWRFAAGRSRREGWRRLPLYLAVFGLWLFLMWWETNCRYFSNFAPVIIACGVLAVSDFPGAARRSTP